MNLGHKGFGTRPKEGTLVGRISKGVPNKMFASGFAGYPHEDKYANPLKIDATGKTQLRAFGDSFTFGSNASPSSLSFINRLNAVLGTGIINYSVGGGGVWSQMNAAQTASWTQGLVYITLMAGFNDIRRNGFTSPTFWRTLNKIKNGLEVILMKGMIGSQVASGSASVTRTGAVFSGFAANTIGGTFQAGALPGATRASSVGGLNPGATWSWTATFTAFGVQIMAADGTTYHYGDVDVFVDGVLVGQHVGDGQYDAVSDGVNDNGRGPVALMYFGFANVSHTVTVVLTHATFSLGVDFFCTLLTPAQAPAVTVFEIPFMSKNGYALLSNPYGSRAAAIAASEVMKAVVLKYRALGYNFGWAFTNKFFAEQNIDPVDSVHPTNGGHAQILRSAFNAIKRPVILYS